MLHMASVRMSDRMRDELRSELENKFATADPKPTMDSSLSQVILDALLEHPAYKAANAFLQDPAIKNLIASSGSSTLKTMLGEFRRTEPVERINVKGFKFNGKEQEFGIKLTMPATMHFAQRYSKYMEVHLDDFEPAARTKLETQMTTKAQELLDWTKRHDDFMNSANQLLKNCNTVGQFLDAWPGAETLLKPEVVQKLNEKGKSSKDLAAAEARKNFDASNAAPVLLVAEIVGAAGGGNNEGTT